MKTSPFLILLAAVLLGGCAAHSTVQNPSGTTWKNVHQNDPLLAGVEVNRYSATIYPGQENLDVYDGNDTHPAEVIYYFWDGRLLTLHYTPRGKEFKKEMTRVTPGSKDLDFIDFSPGSDPHFINHPDPRRKMKPWVNLYTNDPGLAGIEVHQRPYDGSQYEDRTRYDGRHPFEVGYYFWNGRRRTMSFTPYGDLLGDGWCRLKPGDPEWNYADFSLGSDPHFKKHNDPRKPIH